MTVYKEQLVKKSKSSRDDMRKLMLIIAAISLSTVVFMFLFPTAFAMIGIFLIAGIIFGCYYLISSMNIEYEYLLTDSELDIDKIINQRSRKRLTTLNINSVTEFEQVTENTDINSDYTIIDASTGLGDGDWYFEFRHKEHGMCYLIFTPNEEMLELIKPFLPRALKMK